MANTVETLEGLKREVKLEIPATQIDQDVEKRLKKYAPNIKLKGFRQGQIPMSELRRRFGREVRAESINEMMSEKLFSILKEADVTPAAAPSLEPVDIESKETISAVAQFEVYPEIELAPLSGVKLEQVTAEVKDADVDSMLEKLREQHRDWNPVERAAKQGDQLIIDFDGTFEGKPLDKGQAKGFSVEIGSNSMIPGFEEALIGFKVGDEKTIELSFPEEYFEKSVAGKPVSFLIKVHKISEPHLPELDDEFAKKLQIKDMQTLRDDVKSNLEKEVKFRTRNYIKKDLLDKLVELHNFDIPNSMIDQEIKALQQQAHGHHHDHDHEHDENCDHDHPPGFEDKNFEADAKRRVTLGLLLAHSAKKFDIKADDAAVDEKLDEISASFEKPQEIKLIYKSNPELMENIRASVIEDKVVDKLLSEIELNSKVMGFDEFKKLTDNKDG